MITTTAGVQVVADAAVPGAFDVTLGAALSANSVLIAAPTGDVTALTPAEAAVVVQPGASQRQFRVQAANPSLSFALMAVDPTFPGVAAVGRVSAKGFVVRSSLGALETRLDPVSGEVTVQAPGISSRDVLIAVAATLGADGGSPAPPLAVIPADGKAGVWSIVAHGRAFDFVILKADACPTSYIPDADILAATFDIKPTSLGMVSVARAVQTTLRERQIAKAQEI